MTGIGFVPGEGITAIDLDDCRDPVTGALTPEAATVVELMKTYTEVSPSGTGLRLFCFGAVPPKTSGRNNKNGPFEVYDHASPKYLTVTGQHIRGTPKTVEKRQAELDAFHKQYIVGPEGDKPSAPKAGDGPALSLGDGDIVRKCFEARNAPKFALLWNGDEAELLRIGYEKAKKPGVVDGSKVDAALLGMLAFYTDDPEQAKRILLSSPWGQTRAEKWERKTYSKKTLDYVFGNPDRERYKPPAPEVLDATLEATILPFPKAEGHGDGGNDQAGADPKPEAAKPGDGGTASGPTAATEPAAVCDVVTVTGDLADMTTKTLGILVAKNGNPPKIVERGGVLCRFKQDGDRPPVFETLTIDALYGELGFQVKFVKVKYSKGHKVEEEVFPPDRVARTLASLGDWPGIPRVKAVVGTPFFDRSGKLVSEPSFYPDSGVWYYGGLSLPPVPTNPTGEDVRRALELLTVELLGDFPFEDEASKANALALLLLPFVRQMIDGPTPFHLIDAPSEGTGKGLLAECVCFIWTGETVVATTEATSESEWDKKIGSLLMEGPSYICFDNISKPLNSPALAAALTLSVYKTRILGVSKNATCPVECVWVGTGNNVHASKEITRRIVRIRLDAMCERPEERTGFRHPNLPEWAAQNRAQLVWACLTLCQAWVAAGCPKGSQFVASYPAWSGIMSGIMDVIGVPGFLGNKDKRWGTVNTSQGNWSGFVTLWGLHFGELPVTVANLLDLAESNGALPDVIDSPTVRGQLTKLGAALANQVAKVYGYWRIEAAEEDRKTKAQRYRLRDIHGGTGGLATTANTSRA